MAGREYRMRKRAEGLDATRERIVEATAALHYEQGVAATSYVQIAERAGVGPATVYRHFPTLGSLVEACGATVWGAIQPPLPENAAAVFAGLNSRQQRLERLVAELDAFYDRGASGSELPPATGIACRRSTTSCGRSRPAWRRWSGRRSAPGLRTPRSGW